MAMRHPRKRLRTVWMIEVAFATLVLATVLFILQLLFHEPPVWLDVLLVVVVVIVGTIHAWKAFDNWGFMLRDDHLYIEHGVLKHIKSMTPYVRIQHVDTQRNVIDRAAGLSRVGVYTAGVQASRMTIPGLRPAEAGDIREQLRAIATQTGNRDAT